MSAEPEQPMAKRTVLITEETEHGLKIDYVLNDELLALMAQDPSQAFQHLVDATASRRDTDDDRSITEEEVCALVVAIFKIHGVPLAGPEHDFVHARCIAEDPEMSTDHFAAEYCGPVQRVLTQLAEIDLLANGGLDEICDLASDLVEFIRKQPTPALRFTALEGVIYNLVEMHAPDPTPEVE